jgi:hypothetical protein
MSGFSPDWLALREPFDARARDTELLSSVAAHFADRASLTIVDLACGTGATRRAVAPHLLCFQNWVLVDNDLSLLARAADAPATNGCTVRTIPIDLVRDLEAALDGGPDLIVTSALLDLVSDEWLDRLVMECAVRKLPLYAALTYDGRVTFEPDDPFDAAMVNTLNRHQLRDKGFGPALGPTALPALRASCKAAGYEVREGTSDWAVGANDRDLQKAVLTGWARAAQETGDLSTKDIAGWLKRRLDLVTAGRSSLRVGHADVFAYPIS